jgi:hypothetical protein
MFYRVRKCAGVSHVRSHRGNLERLVLLKIPTFWASAGILEGRVVMVHAETLPASDGAFNLNNAVGEERPGIICRLSVVMGSDPCVPEESQVDLHRWSSPLRD